MARRDAPEINAGSMADIAFLLLIFFLVTTTMDSSFGITRLLPPIEEENPDTPPIKDRNLLIVLINNNDDLLVEGAPLEVDELRQTVKDFILNEADDSSLPEFKTISKQEVDDKLNAKNQQLAQEQDPDKRKEFSKAIEKLEAKQLACELYGGDVKVSKGIVSMQNTDLTSYGTYVKVQDEMATAFFELRNEFAIEKLGKPYMKCDELEQSAIDVIYPKSISEAEPVNTNRP